MKNHIFLEGKTALITGASGGIGGAIAEALYGAGANVIINGRCPEKLDILKEKIKKNAEKYTFIEYEDEIYKVPNTFINDDFIIAGLEKQDSLRICTNEVYTIPLNLIDIDAPEKLVKQSLELAGKIDILVNAAGIHELKSFTRITKERSREFMYINYHIPEELSKLVIKSMEKNKWGRIINITSVATHGAAGQSHYNASKAALEGLTKSLASNTNYVQFGVTINAIAPGIIETEMAKRIRGEAKKRNLMMIPLGRFGKPEDVAAAALYIASPAANYFNAQTLHVDGGMVR